MSKKINSAKHTQKFKNNTFHLVACSENAQKIHKVLILRKKSKKWYFQINKQFSKSEIEVRQVVEDVFK